MIWWGIKNQRNWIGNQCWCDGCLKSIKSDTVLQLVLILFWVFAGAGASFGFRNYNSEQGTVNRLYVKASSKRSERERMADVKRSGVFTGPMLNIRLLRTNSSLDWWLCVAGYGTELLWRFGDDVIMLFITLKDKAECLPSKIFWSELQGSCVLKMVSVSDSDFLNGLGYKEGTYKVISN
jgi:hypothetical protein